MDKVNIKNNVAVDVKPVRNHSLSIENRQKASFSGIENVLNSSDDVINLASSQGGLCISGKSLKIERFNVEDGTLTISGSIDALRYTAVKPPLLKRIFK